MLFVSRDEITEVNNYELPEGKSGQFGLWRRQYKIKRGTELLHRSYSSYAIWKEASEVYYGENTFAVNIRRMAYFLEAMGSFPIHEVHGPRNLIRRIAVTFGYPGKGDFVSALRPINLLLACPRLEYVRIDVLTYLVPPKPSSVTFAWENLVATVNTLRKLKAHFGKNMIILTLDPYPCPYEAEYVGDDCLYEEEDKSWLLDIPSQQIIDKVAEGQGSLRECLTVQMATRWAPAARESRVEQGDDGSLPGQKGLTRALRSAAREISPGR